MEQEIRFAIVGLGHIGKRHASHILKQKNAQLVGICDIDINKKNEYPQIPFYSSITQLIENIKVDVLCVCTPNYLHEEHSIIGLNSSCHVVIEKPMALSTASCDRMISTALKNNKIIFAVKQNRYNPPVAIVKELIKNNILGKPYLIQVNCFWNRDDAYYAQSDWRGKKAMDGGCLFTQFSHFIDILYYLNGGIKSVMGLTKNFAHQHNTEFEDSGSFIMESLNGAIVNFNFTTTSFEKNMEGSISIFSKNGTVKIGGQYLNTIEYQNIKNTQLPQINIVEKNNDYGHYQGSMSNHDKMIQNVVDVLLHNAPIMTSAQEGRAVVDIIEQMYNAVLIK